MSPHPAFLDSELTAIATGALAAGAIAHALCDEDDEIALERYKENSALSDGAGPQGVLK
jgi:hypothetical protein